MELATLLKEISLLIGIWVAIYGIDSWRREHKGKRQIELAEETLALFYEARDVISYIRNPLSHTSETDSVERGESEPEVKYECRKQASIVYKRYNEHQALFNRIHSMRYRFMAQIGKEQAQPFDDLRKIVNELLSSANRLAHLWARDYFRTEEQQKEYSETVEKLEAVFWDRCNDEDPINPRLNQVVSDIEKTCSGVISGTGTLYGIVNRKLIKKG